MPVAIEEYLTTSYEPDCDFVDGELVDRHAGYHPHGAVMVELLYCLRKFEFVHPNLILRLRVTPTRIRVADIAVFIREPADQIPKRPPYICIEVLSEYDALRELQPKLDDYAKFGVPHIWLVNPRTRGAWVYKSDGRIEASDGVLRTSDPVVQIPLAEIFTGVDE